MPAAADRVTIALPRTLLFHPRAYHVRRMHAALWVYLAVLALLPPKEDVIELRAVDLATGMGLPVGTIRSWLGHLRKHRYLAVRSVEDRLRVRVQRRIRMDPPKEPEPERLFTVLKLEKALGETGHRKLLTDALAAFPDADLQRALAQAIAVPATEIRRSRTALFLYLLKRHAQDNPSDDPRL